MLKQTSTCTSEWVNWYHTEKVYLKKASHTLSLENILYMIVLEIITMMCEPGGLQELIWDNWDLVNILAFKSCLCNGNNFFFQMHTNKLYVTILETITEFKI